MAAGLWHQGWKPLRRVAALLYRGAQGGLSASVDLLLPPICTLCRQSAALPRDGPLVCESCLRQLPRLAGPRCHRCATPLSALVLDASRCAYCRRRKYAFDGVVALGVYQGLLRDAVLRTKYPQGETLAAALGTLLAEECRQAWSTELPPLVAPLPMHWRRRWTRGGNGVEVIAEAVARALRCPCDPGLLAYCRPTAKQGLLSPAQRFRNVRGALRYARRRLLSGREVLLVDDVLTTGATASEAARVLRRAGAKRVRVAVVARGVGR